MGNRIAVIGSNSFSGASFVAYLLEQGVDVLGISRSSEPHPVFLPYRQVIKNGHGSFDFYQLDINYNLYEIMEILGRFEPEYVINFAAQSMVAESWIKPEEWFQTNVVAMVKFHDQLRKFLFIKKYVHISTPEVYGSCQGIVKESRVYNPSTPYAVSRAASDMSLYSFYKNYGFPVVFTRAANVYGPGQQLYRIIPRAVLFFLTGRKLQLHGGGHSVRSFIHIRDVAQGTLLAALNGTDGDIFHFSTSKNISIRELVEMIVLQTGVDFESCVEVVEDRPGKDAAYLLDSTKAKETLGWKDEITLEQGIEECIAWVKDNLNILRNQKSDYIHKP
ncbi:MAG: GDP-mannose 4,6-dehydratase [Desulfamplus sp.]|nr:GDP-mannose 4,6-dehydratase [Desulfamplus sp.]